MDCYCPLPVVPMRREPSDKSEQVSQLLFGESVTVLEKQAKWSLVRGEDGYEGWIDNLQYTPGAPGHTALVVERTACIETADGPMYVPHGSRVPSGTPGSSAPLPYSAESLEKTGRLYLNSPYLWGGKSISGIDCSGFVQLVFRVHGVTLPRDAWQQAEHGETINLVTEARAGDLAFFDNAEGRIIHVGLLLSDKEILHASGKVRIDPFDHQGIFNRTTGKYSHQLRIIRRMRP